MDDQSGKNGAEDHPNREEEREEPRRFLFPALALLTLLALALFLLWEAGILEGLLDLAGGRSRGGWRGWDWQAVDLRLTLKIRSSGATRRLEVRMASPPERAGYQELALDSQPPPAERLRSGEREYLVYRFNSPAQEVTVTLQGQVFLRRMDLETTGERGGYPSSEDLTPYLMPEEMVESDDPEIQSLSAGVGIETDRGAAVEICRLVGRLLDYRRGAANLGALAALKRGWGNCTDYSHLMVALCRARGIPARTARGLLVERSFGEGEFEGLFHRWVEVYLEGCGWVTFDPTFADEDPGRCERLPPFYLLLGTGEGDPNLRGGDLWSVESTGGSVEVEWGVSAEIEKRGKGEIPERVVSDTTMRGVMANEGGGQALGSRQDPRDPLLALLPLRP